MSMIKQIDGYKIYMNEMLGQGSYGAVYIGVADDTHKKVAIKILKKSSIDSDEYLKNALFSEIKIMQAVKSDNIVGFYDVMESSKNYYIVQELCDGDLSSIVKPGKIVPEQQAKGYLLQICNGFLALVREGIIHRDLKPANVMRKGNQLKLGDFGFAKKTEGTSVKNQTIVGTPLYMSLQILKSEPYSSKCDIWALGFLYYQMLHGYTPWMGKSEFDLIKKIQSKPLKIDSHISQESTDFLSKCLALEEGQRISWDELFVHPIFNGYFLKNSQGNTQFQNKLKMVMSDLRFEINSQNLDLYKILTGLGYKSGEVQLDQARFYQFLKIVSPSLTKAESDYIFGKTDLDKNGSISIHQIQMIMNAHQISLTSINPHIPGVSRLDSNGSNGSNQENSGFILTEKSEKKIRQCFFKLFQILQKQNRILYDVFVKFDKQKSGSLDRMEFRRMLKQLSQEMQNDEIDAAFDLIDKDRSNSIEFIELNEYFSKVNGIPEHLNRPSDPSMEIEKPNNFFQHLIMQNSNNSNQPPPFQQQQGGYGYYPQMQGYPQMYGGFQPQQYQHNPYQNPYQYNPYNQQPQQQQGLFGNNPILNKISQNMHGNEQQQPNNQKGWGW